MRSERDVGMTLLIAVLMLACTKPQPAATSPAITQPATGGPRIVFPDNYAVRVEIAADEETRQQGLMYRDRLPEGTGMIFIFAQPSECPFWMKNTLIPIVHVAHDVPPCLADPCPSYPPNAKSSFVLELAAGVAARHHLADGQVLRFEGLDHVIVR